MAKAAKGDAPMGEDRFWQIIEESRSRVEPDALDEDDEDAFLNAQVEHLKAILGALPAAEILAFDARFDEALGRAYRWDLWGAAYWQEGGCGDDGFMDFRSTLISLGRALFERVVNDPDSLAEVEDLPGVPYLQSEGFQYVARQVYEAKYGPMPPPAPRPGPLPEPAGEPWDFDDPDEAEARLPRLFAKYPEMGG